MPTREELENMKSYEPTDDVKKLVKEKVEEIRRLKGMLHPDVENMTEARKQIEHINLAKRFTELMGKCWHEGAFAQLSNPYDARHGMNVLYCIYCKLELEPDYKSKLPTYSNAADILRVMEERKDYYDFIEKIVKSINYTIPLNVLSYFINDYILNPTALLREAVEFLEGK